MLGAPADPSLRSERPIAPVHECRTHARKLPTACVIEMAAAALR